MLLFASIATLCIGALTFLVAIGKVDSTPLVAVISVVVGSVATLLTSRHDTPGVP